MSPCLKVAFRMAHYSNESKPFKAGKEPWPWRKDYGGCHGLTVSVIYMTRLEGAGVHWSSVAAPGPLAGGRGRESKPVWVGIIIQVGVFSLKL